VEPYLRECVESILKQAFADFELILVNDKSPDNCGAIIDEYVAKDNRIKAIHNAENIGVGLSRKAGLDIAIGEYVIFIDSDDYIKPNMFALLIDKAAREGLDIAVCGFDDITKKIYNIKPCSRDKLIAEPYEYGYLWNKIVKREVYQKCEFSPYQYGEDAYLSRQAYYYAKTIGVVNEPLYFYRYRSDSLSNSASNRERNATHAGINFKKTVEFLRSKYGKNIDMLEPMLSKTVNAFKGYIEWESTNAGLIDFAELMDFYPESRYDLLKKNKRLYKLLMSYRKWRRRLKYWRW
jgi:glycosyltransferase involved in cell wall biosynthesis